eukprot:741633-Rhodomonas_salina.1
MKGVWHSAAADNTVHGEGARTWSRSTWNFDGRGREKRCHGRVQECHDVIYKARAIGREDG